MKTIKALAVSLITTAVLAGCSIRNLLSRLNPTS